MRNLYLVPVALSFVGCASMPSPFQQLALGRVEAISAQSGYEYKKIVAAPVVIGRVVLPGATDVTVAGATRVFTVRLLDGKTISVTSEETFIVGDCVELRHATDLGSITPELNHVNGFLTKSSAC